MPSPAAKPGRVKEDKAAALLEAALEVFAAKGYHNATVKDITDAAEVGTGTFYLYYPSKQAAFAALIDHLFLEALDAIKSARKEEEEVIGKLRISIETIVKFFALRRELARVILVQAVADEPLFEDKIVALHSGLAMLVQLDLDNAVASGVIPPLDTSVAARAMVGTVYEVVLGWLLEDDPTDLFKALPTLVAYNLRGIGAENRQ